MGVDCWASFVGNLKKYIAFEKCDERHIDHRLAPRFRVIGKF